MVFEGAVEAVRNFTVTEREMTKYIIGTISDMDVPLTPANQGKPFAVCPYVWTHRGRFSERAGAGARSRPGSYPRTG